MIHKGALVDVILGAEYQHFDLNAACSGFVYGLVTAFQFVAGGGVDRILVIGSETLSRIVDWDDRGTAVLFADGGTQAVAVGDRQGSLYGLDLADGAPAPGWGNGTGGTLGSGQGCLSSPSGSGIPAQGVIGVGVPGRPPIDSTPSIGPSGAPKLVTFSSRCPKSNQARQLLSNSRP